MAVADDIHESLCSKISCGCKQENFTARAKRSSIRTVEASCAPQQQRDRKGIQASSQLYIRVYFLVSCFVTEVIFSFTWHA